MSDVWGEMVAAVRKFGFESVFRKYYSKYRALVVDVADEEDRCRVLVKVPTLFADSPLANWAEPMVHGGKMDLLGSITGKPSTTGGKFCGSFFPPKVGDWIWVEFKNGDSRYPLYHCESWYGDDERPDAFGEASDWNMMNPIFISRYGHQMYFDESAGAAKFMLKMNNGNMITIDETTGDEKIEIQSERGAYWGWTLNPDLQNTDIKLVLGGEYEETISQAVAIEHEDDVEYTIGGTYDLTVSDAVAFEFEDDFGLTIGGDYDVEVSGDYSMTSKGDTTIEASGEATLKGKTQTIGSGGHPVAHGDVLKDALDALADELTKLTPGSPANNASAIAALIAAGTAFKSAIAKMNSEKTETD